MPSPKVPVVLPYKTATSYPALPVDGVPCAASLHICLVLHECMGPTQNNGLGTAYTLLGEALAGAGHHVTFLYATTKCAHATLDYWAQHYAKKSINFIVLSAVAAGGIEAPDWLANPYRVYLWLKNKNFDVIHFPEYPGNGYFLARAKQLDLAFTKTLLCIGTHGPSMWSRHANNYVVNSVRHLAVDYMERQTAALSDVMISPSQYMVHWMLQQGWTLPERTYVQQNIQSPYALTLCREAREGFPLKEIVFFGRIEPRKGYGLFCDAIDLLPPDALHDITVTFLGASTMLYSGDTADEVKRRAKAWPCPTRILTNKSHEEALDYLYGNPCFVVVPSRDENLCYVVMECLGAGIPFLASHVGGIPELVAEEDRDRVCFFPVQANVLARRMELVLREGLAPAHPALAFKDVRQRWIDWHNRIETLPMQSTVTPANASELISIEDFLPDELKQMAFPSDSRALPS